jgi:hypothetical protein
MGYPNMEPGPLSITTIVYILSLHVIHSIVIAHIKLIDLTKRLKSEGLQRGCTKA